MDSTDSADQPAFAAQAVSSKTIDIPVTVHGGKATTQALVYANAKATGTTTIVSVPYAVDPEVDYSAESPTLVEFFLDDAPDGISLRIVESGFDRLPPGRRDEAFRMNEDGWQQQTQNIERYVTGS